MANVLSTYVIENPDSEETTVVYLFSTPVRCLDLSLPDWDTSIGEANLALEVVVGGREPGMYRVVDSSPARGEASIRTVRSPSHARSAELHAVNGWVRLEAATPGSSVKGSFEATVGASGWVARFNADDCPGGHQP